MSHLSHIAGLYLSLLGYMNRAILHLMFRVLRVHCMRDALPCCANAGGVTQGASLLSTLLEMEGSGGGSYPWAGCTSVSSEFLDRPLQDALRGVHALEPHVWWSLVLAATVSSLLYAVSLLIWPVPCLVRRRQARMRMRSGTAVRLQQASPAARATHPTAPHLHAAFQQSPRMGGTLFVPGGEVAMKVEAASRVVVSGSAWGGARWGCVANLAMVWRWCVCHTHCGCVIPEHCPRRVCNLCLHLSSALPGVRPTKVV